ncbi:MAG TPA: S1C family serine protease [Phycisphaerae bacterium]|nr:S1C family serine protease [Phycisphaerae bacterium]
MHRYTKEETLRRESMRRVMDTYAQGVCLIHGVFTFHDRRGATSAPVKDSEEKPVELEYLGSGFLVSEHGHVVTNRHVAEPWWNNERIAPLVAAGLEPAFIHLTATFPNHEPIPIDPQTIRVSAEDVDVAVFTISASDVPVLPLSDHDPRELRGEPLMLLGYPTGLSALLARADPDVASAVLAEANDTTTMIAALSRRHAISPVITHGTLSDVTNYQLIYDAVTTSGGSGGPVFGPDGEVIGVNFAILRDFQGSNFGVPIGFARPLLP